jgi:hypothetical protein
VELLEQLCDTNTHELREKTAETTASAKDVSTSAQHQHQRKRKEGRLEELR